jgi:crossover junction endodeoxyribonuclease RuvC
MKRIIGIDPALNNTGWGVIQIENNKRCFVAAGVVSINNKLELANRLFLISEALSLIISEHQPDLAAIEKSFVSVNSESTLKLGNARGAILLTLAQNHLQVFEYDATVIKKTITGNGRAEKQQMMAMLRMLLPETNDLIELNHDAFDALAVALTHYHHI